MVGFVPKKTDPDGGDLGGYMVVNTTCLMVLQNTVLYRHQTG